MKKYFIHLYLLIGTLIAGILYGILIYRNHIFPYRYLKSSYNTLSVITSPWAIGIYEGETPFDLKPPKDIKNPIITRSHVSDAEAYFVADPFLFIEDGQYTLFFEILNKEDNQGDLAYAESNDGKNWEYKGLVLDEPFHLSYPYVFKWKEEYYMIPESSEDLSVRLYKASLFPHKWEYIGNLLSGYPYIDPSIFYYNNMWWMFVSSENGVLNLYYSDTLTENWQPHPENPIVRNNKKISRSAGRIFSYEDRLYRVAQDGDGGYGLQVFAVEITELSIDSYEEKLVSDSPIISPSHEGWNRGRMHHLDLHKVEDRWIGVIDGRNK